MKLIESSENYGDSVLNKIMHLYWFCRLKDGDFDVDDHEREGRRNIFKDAEFSALLAQNHH